MGAEVIIRMSGVFIDFETSISIGLLVEVIFISM